MKRLSLIVVLATILFVGCKKDDVDTFDDAAQYAEDLAKIDQYIIDNNITDTLHHDITGIRYKIVEQGNGLQARVGDLILVEYTGYFLDGEVFDSGLFGEDPPRALNAGSMILGWYYMVQEMKEGDNFTIFVPSKYAYGRNGSGSIPPNTVIAFDMKLIRVGE